MAFARSARPKLAKKAVLRWDRIAQKNLLLYPERGLSLNEVASSIVRRCDGAHTVESIVNEVAESFPGAEPAEVERDVLELLDELAARGLLEGLGEP
jgi:pyrroloquinoline quinone biosynthesis protein D